MILTGDGRPLGTCPRCSGYHKFNTERYAPGIFFCRACGLPSTEAQIDNADAPTERAATLAIRNTIARRRRDAMLRRQS